MKMRKYLYIALVFAVTACGGSKDNIFGVKARLENKPESSCSVSGSALELEGGDQVGILSLFASDSVLLMKTSNPKNPFLLHAFSLTDKSNLGDFIVKGRGPGELLSPILKGESGANEGGTVYVFDLSLCASYCLDLKKSISDKNTELHRLLKLPPMTIDAYPFGNNHLAFKPEDDSYTCMVLDDSCAVQKSFSLFPGVSGMEYFDKLSSACVVNQSSGTLAMAMMMFPQVNIIDINSGKRVTTAVSAWYKNWQTLLNSEDDDDKNICYTSIAQAPDCFMALYFGTSLENWAEGAVVPHIHVFDWNGHFKYDISISENLKTITYDETTHILYGADRNDRVYQYDLSGILK